MTAESRLVDQSVRAFVAAVASAETPVPAGGSAVALSGSCAAALLALACHVRQRRAEGEPIHDLVAEAERLQEILLDLVDEDAAAYRAFLHARRDPRAIERLARVPLTIGQACAEIVLLSDALEPRAVPATRGDVRAARHLALAGLRTAIDLTEQNLTLIRDADTRRAIEAELARLRDRG